MQLREINKSRYRKHLRVVFGGMASTLLLLTLATSTLFIYFFSSPEAEHFWHNLAGVAVAAAIVVFVVKMFRHHPYMVEVVYVWDLKQQLNRIHRKQRQIKTAVENNNVDAMNIMNFMYRGSKQLYELDDNTITMDDLMRKIQVLDERMDAAGLSLSTDFYKPAMLDQF